MKQKLTMVASDGEDEKDGDKDSDFFSRFFKFGESRCGMMLVLMMFKQTPEVRMAQSGTANYLDMKNIANYKKHQTFVLAGVVAVEVTDGPKIKFVPGRKDSLASPEEGRIPAANQGVQQKMATFHRMGLSHRDIVALSGGLSLGRKEQESCGIDDVVQIPIYLRFIDSSYFMKLLIGEHMTNVMIHPAERALLEDDNLRHYVLEYTLPQNEDVFFRDYAKAHQKFSELGFISSDD